MHIKFCILYNQTKITIVTCSIGFHIIYVEQQPKLDC
jgi:hypothetical protein